MAESWTTGDGDMPSATGDTAGFSSWLLARTGNAVDVLVDRALNKPQLGMDPAQQYGVDGNGNIYTLGRSNGQITAQVQTTKAANGNMLLLLAVVAVVLMSGSK